MGRIGVHGGAAVVDHGSCPVVEDGLAGTDAAVVICARVIPPEGRPAGRVLRGQPAGADAHARGADGVSGIDVAAGEGRPRPDADLLAERRSASHGTGRVGLQAGAYMVSG
jgi:hypothetical protein